MNKVKYPNITAKIIDRDNNAFTILGVVIRALKSAGISAEEIAAFREEATAKDYDHLLATVMRWVNVE